MVYYSWFIIKYHEAMKHVRSLQISDDIRRYISKAKEDHDEKSLKGLRALKDNS